MFNLVFNATFLYKNIVDKILSRCLLFLPLQILFYYFFLFTRIYIYNLNRRFFVNAVRVALRIIRQRRIFSSTKRASYESSPVCRALNSRCFALAQSLIIARRCIGEIWNCREIDEAWLRCLIALVQRCTINQIISGR